MGEYRTARMSFQSVAIRYPARKPPPSEREGRRAKVSTISGSDG
jgi:hypothetical protein